MQQTGDLVHRSRCRNPSFPLNVESAYHDFSSQLTSSCKPSRRTSCTDAFRLSLTLSTRSDSVPTLFSQRGRCSIASRHVRQADRSEASIRCQRDLGFLGVQTSYLGADAVSFQSLREIRSTFEAGLPLLIGPVTHPLHLVLAYMGLLHHVCSELAYQFQYPSLNTTV